MRSLLVTSHFPFGLPSGGRLRTRHLAKALAKLGPVSLLCLEDEDASAAAHREARRVCASIHHPCFRGTHPEAKLPLHLRVPGARWWDERPLAVQSLYRKAIHTALLDLPLDTFDQIVVRYAGYAQYFFLDPRLKRFRDRLVVDADDNELRAALTAGFESHSPLELLRYERYYRNLRRSRACLVVSDIDREFFLERSLAPEVFLAPNVVDVPRQRPPGKKTSRTPTLLFCGSLDYPPNTEGVCEFAKKVFPKIRAVHGNARFSIVGRNPPPTVNDLARLAGVDVHGNVPDLAPHYARASLVVVPLAQGMGTRIKILESFAHGRPVVSTAIGAEGLNLRPGVDALIVPTIAKMAAPCLQVLGDRSLAESLAEEGFRVVRHEHAPSKLAEAVSLLLPEARP